LTASLAVVGFIHESLLFSFWHTQKMLAANISSKDRGEYIRHSVFGRLGDFLFRILSIEHLRIG
jgi:hypothetical protein